MFTFRMQSGYWYSGTSKGSDDVQCLVMRNPKDNMWQGRVFKTEKGNPFKIIDGEQYYTEKDIHVRSVLDECDRIHNKINVLEQAKKND